jgi:hypothetical protein
VPLRNVAIDASKQASALTSHPSDRSRRTQAAGWAEAALS